MPDVTLEFLGKQMRRMFGELQRMDGKLDDIKNEITVLTGAFMRQDAERERRDRSAAALLASQRWLGGRLSAEKARIAMACRLARIVERASDGPASSP